MPTDVGQPVQHKLDNTAGFHRHAAVLRPADLVGQSGIRCGGGLADQFAASTRNAGGVRSLDVLCFRVAAMYHSLDVVDSPPAVSE